MYFNNGIVYSPCGLLEYFMCNIRRKWLSTQLGQRFNPYFTASDVSIVCSLLFPHPQPLPQLLCSFLSIMTMNIFRLAGDMSHVISIFLLIIRLSVTKNAVGISIKTQELYLLVFITRYLDLFTTFYSFYNSIMKILYICATAYVIYMVYGTEPFKTNYEKSHDSFLHWYFAVIPCFLLALITIFFEGFDFLELFWTFSIYLEALAIVPQLILLQRYREVENLTGHYVFFLGLYRALYILNWVYRAYHEPYYQHNYIVYACAGIQTCLYLDFFYYYIISKSTGAKFSLPS